ncbi:MAG: hypothetical protein WAK95_11785 [Desulfobacterales bacterium]
MKPNSPYPHAAGRPRAQTAQAAYKQFDATELYCANCRRAVPVRKRLLLVLPEGDKYEYLCAFCSASVGTKLDRSGPPPGIVM